MRYVALSIAFLVLLALFGSPLVGFASVAAAEMSEPETTTDTQSLSAATQPTETAVQTQLASSLASDELATPETTFAIFLQSDRSADWQITLQYELETDTEQEAFDDIAAEFETGTGEVGPDITLYENIAALSAEHTDREMRIEDVERTSSRQGTVGTLELSFTWTEFLAEDGDRLVFQDALQTPDNDSWLTSLTEGQTLRVHTPRGYSITSANVAFSDNTVEVEGPYTFDSEDQVRITLEESAFGTASWQFLGAALVIAAGIVSGALLLRRKETTATEPSPTPNGGVETAASSSSSQPAVTEEDPLDDEDLSLLSDDERVERLLERNGGRMRQAKIVSETGWSDAKVSQLLSAMADDEQIKKLRIGRENLISLPDVQALGPTPNGDDSDENKDDTDAADR